MGLKQLTFHHHPEEVCQHEIVKEYREENAANRSRSHEHLLDNEIENLTSNLIKM